MTVRLLTFVVWALLAFSSAFWGLQVFARGAAVPEGVHAAAANTALNGSLARVLGVVETPEEEDPEAAEPNEADRFRLLGVVAPDAARGGREGLAIISVAGQPARTWRVGAVVDGELVLQAVTRRGAALGPRDEDPTVELSLPEASGPQSNGPLAPIARPGMVPAVGQAAFRPNPAMPGVGPGGFRPGMPGQALRPGAEDAAAAGANGADGADGDTN